jgi:nucleoside-diphosphate-sugar epimerase
MTRPRPIAITGATGFIGGALTRACLDGGLAIRCLVRRRGPEATALERAGATLVEGDLSDPAALAALCGGAGGEDGARAVVHLAADMRKDDLERSREINVRGTERLLRAAADAGVGVFQFVSSISVYRGTPSATRVFTEAIEPVPHPGLNAYSISKLEAEHAVARFCADSDLDYTILRPTNVRGAGSRPWDGEIEGHVRQYRISFGDVPFDFVHIDDLVDGMRAALDARAARNQTFNLGAEMVPLRVFYEHIADQVGVRVLRTPTPIDAVIRHAIDGVARLKGQVRSTAYTVQSYYPHTHAAQAFGYAPKRLIGGAGR